MGVLAVAAAALGVVVALWAADTATHRDQVGRKVTLGGTSIAGLHRAQLDSAVAGLAATYAKAQVVVDADGGGFHATAPELGLSVVQDRTAASALAVGRHGFFVPRIWEWARSFVVTRPAPVTIAVDQASMARIVAERDPQRTAPTEPSLTVKDDHVATAPGKPGRGISTPSVLAALQRAGPKGLPLHISVARDDLPPRFTTADAQRLADQAEQIAAPGLPVTAGGTAAIIPATTLRGWFRAQATAADLRLAVDTAGVPDALATLYPNPVVAPVDAGFTVNGGKVSITPSKAGTACCGTDATALIQSTLLNRPATATALGLPLKAAAPTRDDDAARKLQIVEPIGTFTTNHAAGQPRVLNIHRIADQIQGVVIAPGATFSINNFIGPRTAAKGYVSAPTIDENYNFTDDIGGGISQFATTIFNAAFFSGLDIPGYFMHGIYISRYPYGRESTISFPEPDVRIRNNTPYGVLIWPTYTDTSVTVTMYSTKYVSGEQTNQTKTPKGVCTAVSTERTRTYVDGRKAVDNFTGLYSPGEGVECP
ncbi:MAG: VanW family protein [Actinomycetota bacterium]|nr:VanW family protein [Actinomycetota bacterium]